MEWIPQGVGNIQMVNNEQNLLGSDLVTVEAMGPNRDDLFFVIWHIITLDVAIMRGVNSGQIGMHIFINNTHRLWLSNDYELALKGSVCAEKTFPTHNITPPPPTWTADTKQVVSMDSSSSH